MGMPSAWRRPSVPPRGRDDARRLQENFPSVYR